MATVPQNAERDSEIAALHVKGHSTALIAYTYDLSEGHVRRILKARRGQAPLPTSTQARASSSRI
jgi:transposase